MRYSTLERSQLMNLRKENNQKDAVKCETCGSVWFEEVDVARFREDHLVVEGQRVPRLESSNYVLLKCICCKDYTAPNNTHTPMAQVKNYYSHLIETLEGVHDKRIKEEKKDENPA